MSTTSLSSAYTGRDSSVEMTGLYVSSLLFVLVDPVSSVALLVFSLCLCADRKSLLSPICSVKFDRYRF